MITENRKLSIKDLSRNRNDVDLEINWNKTPQVSNAKMIRLTVGDSEALISAEHLWTIVFAISEGERQADLIDRQSTKIPVTAYHTQIQIKAGRDTRAGEMFEVPISIIVDEKTGQMKVTG